MPGQFINDDLYMVIRKQLSSKGNTNEFFVVHGPCFCPIFNFFYQFGVESRDFPSQGLVVLKKC